MNLPKNKVSVTVISTPAWSGMRPVSESWFQDSRELFMREAPMYELHEL